jgi:methionine-rich copper-binding protein CopC
MRKLAIGCYAVLLVLLVAAPAVASRIAPEYQNSEPSAGGTVHEPPDRIEITFSEPLDPGSSMTVTDACDRRVDDGATEVSGSTMSIGLEDKPAGRYLVGYVARGIGGLTGETEDSFTFTAHAGAPCGPGAGGHGGHGGHGNGHGNGNGGHNGNHGGSHHSGGSHAGGDHAAGSHSGSDHSGMDHSTMGTSAHTDHGSTEHDSHEGDHHSGSGHDAVASGPEIDGITSSDTQRGLLTRADSTTLMISLALCAALGILGGVVLRATGAK